MKPNLSRRAPLHGALLTTALIAACSQGGARTQNTPPPGTPFENYVALGDSITAGYQSGGLRADGQRDAYPALLARLAGTEFNAPLTRDPGCPPPMGARPAAQSCQRLNPGVNITNFAVPGARVEDLTTKTAANATGNTGALYNLILGPGDTQVSAALKAKPRFISIWIGANNALAAAANGDASAVTPPAQFERAYENVLRTLQPAQANTILLTVPDVTRAPALIPGPKLTALGVGDASCKNSPNRVAVSRVFSGQLPVSCDAPYALTPTEAQRIQGTIAAYNASIHKLARRYNAKVFPVSELQTPNEASYDLGSSAPFGEEYSLDGVHPSTQAHERLARALASFLNREHGTSIPTDRALF